MSKTQNYYDLLPVGRLSIIPLESCSELGKKVDDFLVQWRRERESQHKHTLAYNDYERDTYIVEHSNPRFGTGEGKGMIHKSVRGDDLYIMVDVCNYSLKYSLFGQESPMSPDDHFQDLKRIIGAVGGKARRITVLMPFLYESRQEKRTGRESLDCGIALQELVNMGVENILTFDAHDVRVQNAIPLNGFENIQPHYQFIKNILRHGRDIKIDSKHLMVISPDEGGMKRSIYLANNLGVDMGMFYKRRDYRRVVNGRNPIIAHEFLGSDVEGKDMIIMDDMISSGDSILDVAEVLHNMGARDIYMCATFGLFTNGLERFDEAYKKGHFTKLFTTNLVYQRPELFEREYYQGVDLSKYVALILDALNHDTSIGDLLNPISRIQNVIKKYNNGEPV